MDALALELLVLCTQAQSSALDCAWDILLERQVLLCTFRKHYC